MKKITLFFICLLSISSYGQVIGNLDNNFATGNTGGLAYIGTAENYNPRSIDFENYTGKIFVGGSLKYDSNNTYGFVSRSNYNGYLGNNDFFLVSDLGNNTRIVKIKASNPGSSFCIVAGTYAISTGGFGGFIRKYDGLNNTDTNFGNNGTQLFTSTVRDFIILSNGSILILFENESLLKLTSQGQIDTSFGTNGIVNLPVVSPNFFTKNIIEQSDGKLVLPGNYLISFSPYTLQCGVLRCNSNGNVDTSFGTNGYFRDNQTGFPINGVIQSDGKIVVGYQDSNATQKNLLRLTSNGVLDSSFGNGGRFISNYPSGSYLDRINIEYDDKILMCGSIGFNSSSFINSSMERVSNAGNANLDFENNSSYSIPSEFYDLTTISHSYAVGVEIDYGTTNYAGPYSMRLKRFITKAPLISLIGNAYGQGNFTTDLDMATADGTIYTLNNVSLQAGGSVKFRLDHDWIVNWGASTTNTFPTGISTMGLSDISIPSTGVYNITFNLATYEFNFQNALATESFNSSKVISVYPNPTSSILNIQNQNNTTIDKIVITDLTGKKVLEQHNANQVNVANLAKGLYVIEAFFGDEKLVSKFVKE